MTDRMLALTYLYGAPTQAEMSRDLFGRKTLIAGRGEWMPYLDNYGWGLRNSLWPRRLTA